MQPRSSDLARSLSLGGSLACGCFNPGSHVHLQAPPPATAPLAERGAVYEQLRARAQIDTPHPVVGLRR